jgi:hypothetical protein
MEETESEVCWYLRFFTFSKYLLWISGVIILLYILRRRLHTFAMTTSKMK